MTGRRMAPLEPTRRRPKWAGDAVVGVDRGDSAAGLIGDGAGGLSDYGATVGSRHQ
jgi:hypothetical protein